MNLRDAVLTIAGLAVIAAIAVYFYDRHMATERAVREKAQALIADGLCRRAYGETYLHNARLNKCCLSGEVGSSCQ
jgi:hypothetical protein